MLNRFITLLAMVSTLLFMSVSQAVAVDIFLVIPDVTDGPGGCGQSRDGQYPGAIKVISWTLEASQPGTFHGGGGGGAGKASIEDLSVTKYRDACTSLLFMRTFTGDHFEKVRLDVRSPAGEIVIQIEMTNVLVSSVGAGGSSEEEALVDKVNFNFEKIKMLQWTVVDGRRVGDPKEACWDFGMNEARC